MPFQKGRAKTGGKKSGTHNKITRDVVALLDSLGCNPLEGLARIATDEKVPIAIRARCHAEVAKYVHPQLKSVEVSGPAGGPISVDVSNPHERILSELARLETGSDPAPGSGEPESSAS